MRVKLNKNIWNELRKEARRVYPAEAFIFLLGNKSRKEISIDYINIPDDTEVVRTSEAVEIRECTITLMEKVAKQLGVRLLGSVHTHPDGDNFEWETVAVPSIADYEGAWERDLMGVLLTRKQGKRWKYDLRFYNPKGMYATEIGSD